MLGLVSFFTLALALGFKHSYDADHLLAVSAALRKAKSFGESLRAGMSWAAGHMITAAIITLLLFAFKDSILKNVLGHFEIIAGLMLIALGAFSLLDFFKFHSHRHSHGSVEHSHFHLHPKDRRSHLHRHMLGIGIVHGLASNDELITLLAASLGAATIGSILLGVGFFSMGVVAGMALFSMAFAYPLIKKRNEKAYRLVSLASGSASVFYGSLMIMGMV